MVANAWKGRLWQAVTELRGRYCRIQERIRWYNPGQKRVFRGMMFFLFINAALLAAGIIVLYLLIKKL